jgi:hypothetical protein
MPTDAERVFNERIVTAREAILGRVRTGELDLVREAVAQALAQVQQQAPDAPLTADRADALRQRYEAAFQQLQQDLTQAAEQERQQAQEETIEAHEAALVAAALALGFSEDDVPPRTQWAPDIRGRIRIHINVRRGLDDDRTPSSMITRVLQLTGSDVGDAIDQAVQQGKSVAETTRNITAAIANDDLSGALAEVGLGRLVDADSDFSMQSAKQLGSNLRRIIAHEVASVADEAGKTLSALNPAVDLIEWTLSGRHHTLESSPDVCDVLAVADLHGYGSGIYHPKTVPSLPHPHCECRQRTILKSESDFFSGESRDIPDEPNLEFGEVKRLMEDMEGERTITEAHVANQLGMLRNVINAVWENPRD